GTVAGETEFFDVIFKFGWGPTMASMVSDVLPWAEIVLALALLTKVLPRVAAVLTLPMIAGFIASNAYAITQGVVEFPECGYCFGVLEKFLGSPTPAMSLSIDIAMFVASLLVIFVHPAPFFNLRPSAEESSAKSRLRVFLSGLLLGTVGLHRFYLRKWGTAVVMVIVTGVAVWGLAAYGKDVGLPLLTVVGSWAVADSLVALGGIAEDRAGLPVKNW
ncbi:NINE protein, partial [Chloroflexota bacterium]